MLKKLKNNIVSTILTLFLLTTPTISSTITFAPDINQFSPAITEAAIGILSVSYPFLNGFTLSVESTDVNGQTELDFDSMQGAQILFSIKCEAIENLGNNTYYDTHTGETHERVTHLDVSPICLESNSYIEHPNDLKIRVSLKIDNNSRMLFDPQGYINESIKFVFTNK